MAAKSVHAVTGRSRHRSPVVNAGLFPLVTRFTPPFTVKRKPFMFSGFL
jgi:hypothetical protein